jgi:hypothetical protein
MNLAFGTELDAAISHALTLESVGFDRGLRYLQGIEHVLALIVFCRARLTAPALRAAALRRHRIAPCPVLPHELAAARATAHLMRMSFSASYFPFLVTATLCVHATGCLPLVDALGPLPDIITVAACPPSLFLTPAAPSRDPRLISAQAIIELTICAVNSFRRISASGGAAFCLHLLAFFATALYAHLPGRPPVRIPSSVVFECATARLANALLINAPAILSASFAFYDAYFAGQFDPLSFAPPLFTDSTVAKQVDIAAGLSLVPCIRALHSQAAALVLLRSDSANLPSALSDLADSADAMARSLRAAPLFPQEMLRSPPCFEVIFPCVAVRAAEVCRPLAALHRCHIRSTVELPSCPIAEFQSHFAIGLASTLRLMIILALGTAACDRATPPGPLSPPAAGRPLITVSVHTPETLPNFGCFPWFHGLVLTFSDGFSAKALAQLSPNDFPRPPRLSQTYIAYRILLEATQLQVVHEPANRCLALLLALP